MGYLTLILNILAGFFKALPLIDKWFKKSSSTEGDEASSDVIKDRREMEEDPNARPPSNPICIIIFATSILILLLGASCDPAPDMGVKERRINCESNTLRANKPQFDMPICPNGNGQSCFTQQDMGIMLGAFKKCLRELEMCQDGSTD